MQKASLIIKSGSFSGTRFEIATPDVIIGRTPTSDLTLVDEGVSREHAVISWDEDRFSLEDLQPSVEHPAAGTMRAGDFIAAWRLHDMLHLRQFVHAMAVNTARRLSNWKTRYAGEL